MTTRIFTLYSQREATRDDDMLTLSLRELLPDDGGEVVIHNQAGTDVTVLTDDPVTDRGIERDHVTRAGHDVAGFAYCRFAGGITVFYPRTHSLCVTDVETETEAV
ncbi:MAG TPA: hypothetical protein VNF99_17490 [Stellaceae bacterium]|nr:hypothetical protein [Stellaceae bacterium]